MIRKTILAALPLILLIAGCDRTPDQPDSVGLNELRTEIEQLTNTVGRLEFRVYELEDHHNDLPQTRAPDTYQPETDSGAAESANDADTRDDGGAGDNGRYDLTPVD